MILVRAEITDLVEQEDQFMGAGEDPFDGPYAGPANPFMMDSGASQDMCAPACGR